MSTKKKKKRTAMFRATVTFPRVLLKPIAVFLGAQLEGLKKRRKRIAADDPFKNIARISDNASPDADAEEQFGHARTTAIKTQLDEKIKQTRKALKALKKGTYGTCEDCKKMIDTDRLRIYPEATLCVGCERNRSKK